MFVNFARENNWNDWSVTKIASNKLQPAIIFIADWSVDHCLD